MIVLDTHTWLWWETDRGKLSELGRAAIEGASELGVSAVTLYEMARLSATGRIRPQPDIGLWLEQTLSLSNVQSLPITAAIAARAAGFDRSMPGDPADRLIAATALEHHATLVTKDRRLLAIPELNAIW